MADAGAETTIESLEVREGYRLAIFQAEGQTVLRLLDAGGGEPLRVEIGPNGPVLHIGTGLSIAVDGDLSFAADKVAIRGRQGIELRSDADLVMRCTGDIVSEAREQHVCARLGAIELEANDDVRLLGERIRLNC